MHESMEDLKKDIKFYKFEDDEVKHDSIVKQEVKKAKKAGMKEAFTIQE